MHKFWGKVRTHNQRGKTLGFPTANVSLHEHSPSSSKKIPEGIYASITKIVNREYKSITFIGTVKTFNEKKYHSETYILDFDRNIYGKWIAVNLLKKIRGNQKFISASELISQMKKDEQDAREYFTKIRT